MINKLNSAVHTGIAFRSIYQVEGPEMKETLKEWANHCIDTGTEFSITHFDNPTPLAVLAISDEKFFRPGWGSEVARWQRIIEDSNMDTTQDVKYYPQYFEKLPAEPPKTLNYKV